MHFLPSASTYVHRYSFFTLTLSWSCAAFFDFFAFFAFFAFFLLTRVFSDSTCEVRCFRAASTSEARKIFSQPSKPQRVSSVP